MKNENLIKARKKKGLTQEKLAHLLGYKGRQAVANWENGYNLPPLSIALGVAELLGEDVSLLFGFEVQENHINIRFV
ncbi:TPA: helix-turn-helix transcriptional regulator [Bacillus cereus]|uniref:DNA-binding XRE family transcriptional regulator n=2 Tax=Bacillus cereus group TaxID=86661 RepID=A0A4R4BG14_BACTU|nr:MULTISPECIES: helix-turn-helix transcriptional regulator [Bacillus cereus group]MBY0039439.1 helix-turn-helix transcriptional regulator [Bacillus cereus]PES69594.1 transcriptional regulator [Bacillus cereus]PFI76934.1 transcriptional regulator [Bacillus cereus]TCW55298.1 DNA-binding XRE family transcriptional regulator [Bacillus thuringiensis]TCW55489.1 DNA-binding XRE family transcriptional regulator [Bacillus thuringiensis]